MSGLPDPHEIDALSTLELCARIDALTAELHDALAQFRLARDSAPAAELPATIYAPERRAA